MLIRVFYYIIIILQKIGFSLRDLLAHVDEEIYKLDPVSHKEVSVSLSYSQIPIKGSILVIFKLRKAFLPFALWYPCSGLLSVLFFKGF